MRFLEWLKSIGDPGEKLEPSQFIQHQSEDGNESGAILIHNDETKEIIKRNYYSSETDSLFHNGFVSEFLFDQIASSSSIVNETVQSGRLVQVIASPSISKGLSSRTLSIMKSSNLMTGNVVLTQTKKIAGQLRFTPASAAKIVTPMIVWQIMNALAGVSHLAKINTKLEQISRGIERLTLKMKKTIILLAVISILYFTGCESPSDPTPKEPSFETETLQLFFQVEGHTVSTKQNTKIGKVYSIKVSGTYSLGWGWDCDGAFYRNITNGVWWNYYLPAMQQYTINGSNELRPILDEFNPERTYIFHINGDGNKIVIKNTDDSVGDNSGYLIFEISEIN